MAHINRVARLRDCGIYRDFTWADDVPDFRRYNLIYGGNGTGKDYAEPPDGTPRVSSGSGREGRCLPH